MQQVKLRDKVSGIIQTAISSDELYSEQSALFLEKVQEANWLKLLVQEAKALFETPQPDTPTKERLLRLLQEAVHLDHSGLLIHLVEKYLAPFLAPEMDAQTNSLDSPLMRRIMDCL